jgi:hypothetical protein
MTKPNPSSSIVFSRESWSSPRRLEVCHGGQTRFRISVANVLGLAEHGIRDEITLK